MKYQSYLPFDSTTVANYVAWASGIGTALSALGWQKSTDTGQVVWGNVTTVPVAPPTAQSFILTGAWVGGTGYAGQATTGPLSGVTSSGLTYQCLLGTASAGALTAIVGASSTFVITAVASASAGQTVYTVPATVTSAVLGQQFIVTIGGSNLASLNTGTFVCTAFTTTSITLTNGVGTAQASVTGGSPGAQMISATGITTYKFPSTVLVGTSSAGGLNGHSLIVSGFTGGGVGDNGTFTVLASGGDGSANYYFSVTLSGTSAGTGAGGVVAENTPPASDSLHWIPYNYEIWKSSDACTATMPIVLRFVYYKNGNNNPSMNFIAGTASTGTGFVSGNIMSASSTTTEFTYGPSGSPSGSTGIESDFCVGTSGGSLSIALFRGSTNAAAPLHLVFDRAKDNFGGELDTYVTCLATGLSGGVGNTGGYQILFKPGIGNTFPAGSAISGWPSLSVIGISSLTYNGLSPILPIFPLVGYLANPCLGAIMMKTGDCTDGSLVTGYMYGAQHTWVMSKSTGATNQGSSCAIGTRWE